MADNILFKRGKLDNLPEALNSGQILFAIDDTDTNNITGSIFLDYTHNDGTTEIQRRAKLNADAHKLVSPIEIQIGETKKKINSDLGLTQMTWSLADIGANISNFSYDDSTKKIRLSINGSDVSLITIPDASNDIAGFINTGVQDFRGPKTFYDNLTIGNTGFKGTSTPNTYLRIYQSRNSGSSSSYNYGSSTLFASQGRLGIEVSETTTRATSSGTYYFDSNKSFYPGTSNSYNLGASTYYWKNAYINSIYGNQLGNSTKHWNNAYINNISIYGTLTLNSPLNITIGNITKSFNGNQNLNWTPEEVISIFEWQDIPPSPEDNNPGGLTLFLTTNGVEKTAIIPEASTTSRGVVSTTNQVFTGNKSLSNSSFSIFNENNSLTLTNSSLSILNGNNSSTLTDSSLLIAKENNSFNITDSSLSIIKENSNFNITLNDNNVKFLYGNSNGIIMNALSLYPNSNVTIDLGTGSNRWKNIYGNIIGNVTGSASNWAKKPNFNISNTANGAKTAIDGSEDNYTLYLPTEISGLSKISTAEIDGLNKISTSNDKFIFNIDNSSYTLGAHDDDNKNILTDKNYTNYIKQRLVLNSSNTSGILQITSNDIEEGEENNKYVKSLSILETSVSIGSNSVTADNFIGKAESANKWTNSVQFSISNTANDNDPINVDGSSSSYVLNIPTQMSGFESIKVDGNEVYHMGNIVCSTSAPTPAPGMIWLCPVQTTA